jgi:hypothetical protein
MFISITDRSVYPEVKKKPEIKDAFTGHKGT